MGATSSVEDATESAESAEDSLSEEEAEVVCAESVCGKSAQNIAAEIGNAKRKARFMSRAEIFVIVLMYGIASVCFYESKYNR